MRARLIKTDLGVAALLLLAIAACYLNVLSGEFQFDDYNVIVNNASVHGWAQWASSPAGIRPLLKLSYALNWTHETGVFAYHVTNLLIHFANACLVYRLSQLVVPASDEPGKAHSISLVTALLFAVHPIHTEAVSYICGRSVSLMTFFYLAALLSYATGRTRNNPFTLHLLTPLLFILALGSKETAVTLPLALLLWEISQGGGWRDVFKRQGMVWLLSLCVFLYFLANNAYFSHIERSAGLSSFHGNLATQLNAFAYLLKQWTLPFGLNIDPDLPRLNDLSAALPALIVCCALLAISWQYRRRQWVSFALGWAILQLIPLYLFLPRLDIANERQLYLTSWPLLLALSIELRQKLSKRTFLGAFLMLALTFSGLTLVRNQDYASEIALWESTVKHSPDKARGHNNLGYAYLLAHRYPEARREFSTTLQLDPTFYRAKYNLHRTEVEMAQPAQ